MFSFLHLLIFKNMYQFRTFFTRHVNKRAKVCIGAHEFQGIIVLLWYTSRNVQVMSLLCCFQAGLRIRITVLRMWIHISFWLKRGSGYSFSLSCDPVPHLNPDPLQNDMTATTGLEPLQGPFWASRPPWASTALHGPFWASKSFEFWHTNADPDSALHWNADADADPTS